MAFYLSLDDKDRSEQIVADNQWHGIVIDGALSHEVPPVDFQFEYDLYGKQFLNATARKSGNIWIAFVRMPTLDRFAQRPYYVDAKESDWGAALGGIMRSIRLPVTGVGVMYRTKIEGLTIVNRVLIGDPK